MKSQGIVFDTGCVLCDNNDRCIANTYTYQGAVYSGAGATSVCACYGVVRSCLDAAALIPAATWNASTAGLLPNQCGMLSQPDALSDCGEYYIIVDMIPFGGGCWPSS